MSLTRAAPAVSRYRETPGLRRAPKSRRRQQVCSVIAVVGNLSRADFARVRGIVLAMIPRRFAFFRTTRGLFFLLAWLVYLPSVRSAQTGGSLQPASPTAAPLLQAVLLDLADKPVVLKQLVGKVVVVLHQDRYSSEQNELFKDKLSALVARFPEQLRVVALADAGGYNFWPAKGYVKDALRSVEQKGGAIVAVDWKGAVRKAYQIAPKQSAIFVLDKRQELAQFSHGTLNPVENQQLAEIIESLIAK